MLQLLTHLLKPLIEAIYRDEPSTLQDLINATGRVTTGFTFVIALYSLSLTGLNLEQYLDKIAISKYIPSLTDPWHLLNALSVVVLLRIIGARTLMKIKELAKPLLVEILRDIVRPEERAEGRAEGRVEGRVEGRAEQAAFTRDWLEEQRQAGRIAFSDDLEVPILGENGHGNDHEEKGDG